MAIQPSGKGRVCKTLIPGSNPGVASKQAPVLENERIGTITVKVGDELIEEIEIKAEKEVKKRGILDYFGLIAKIYSGTIKIMEKTT